MRRLDFRRPLSCEVSEAAILATHEQAQARVIREHQDRHVATRDLVLFTCDSTQLGTITGVASDLRQAGYAVSLRWLYDHKHEIIGLAIVGGAS